MKTNTIIYGLLLSLILQMGCLGASHDGEFLIEAPFEVFNQAALDSFMTWNGQHCDNCHGNGQSQGGFPGAHSMGAMIALGYIVPGNPASSPYMTAAMSSIDPMPPLGKRPQAELDMAWDAILCAIGPEGAAGPTDPNCSP